MRAKIYHNPRCSKSRAALALLRERNVEVEIVEVGAAARIGRPPEQVLELLE